MCVEGEEMLRYALTDMLQQPNRQIFLPVTDELPELLHMWAVEIKVNNLQGSSASQLGKWTLALPFIFVQQSHAVMLFGTYRPVSFLHSH